MGGRGAGKTQNPTNDAGDADADNGKEDEALQEALHVSILTHQRNFPTLLVCLACPSRNKSKG